MSVNAIPPDLTSETVLFANRAAAEAFFAAFEIPDATETTFGVVKKAEAVSYTFTPLANSDSAMINVDGTPVAEVPTKASFDELKDSYETLVAAFEDLKQKLEDAEIIAT